MASRGLTIYQPQLQVPVAEMPELKSGNVGVAAAKTAGAVLRTYERKLRQEGAAWVASTITGLRNEYGQRLQEAELSGTAGPGFADGLAGEFAKRIEALRKEAPPYSVGAFEAGVADVFNDIGEAGRAIEDEARTRQSEAEVERSLDHLAAVAARDPSRTLSVRDEGDAVLRAIAARPDIRPRLEAKVQGIATAGLTALGKQDPSRLVELFKSGEAKAYIADPKSYHATQERAKVDARRGAAREAASAAVLSTRGMLDAEAQLARIVDGQSFVELRDPDPGELGRERVRELRKKIDAARARVERDADELDAAATRLSSGKHLDPAEDGHRRGANALYRDHFLPGLDGLDPDEARRRKVDFVALTGLVPDLTKDEINANLRSGDPRRVADAATFIDGLTAKGRGLENDFDPADLRLARGVRALKRAGFDAVAAAKRYAEGLELGPEDLVRRGRQLSGLVGAQSMAHDAMQSIRRTFKMPNGDALRLQDPTDSGQREGAFRTLEKNAGDEPEFESVVQYRKREDSTDGLVYREVGLPRYVSDNYWGRYQVQDVEILADDNTIIRARINKSSAANLNANCHGQTFARGKVWIDNSQVGKLLIHDGYSEIAREGARRGDIVVYWRDDQAVHSATIVAIEPDGTIIVEGKHGQEHRLRRTPLNEQWPPASEPEEVATPKLYRKRRGSI